MTARMVAAATPEESAERDRLARESGIPQRVLMENAGRAAAAILHRVWPRGRCVIVAGSGNNGGDAAVVARLLRVWGRPVDLIAVGSSPPDPALLHGHELRVAGSEGLAEALAEAAVVVDGILGTGLSGPARGRAADAIAAINGAGRPVLSLDLPSGLEGTTGAVEGPAVRADLTVCFGWPKRGLLFQPARALCGRLVAVEIGFPPWSDARAHLIGPEWARETLPARAADAHKGRAGRLLVLAGHEGMAGAAALSAMAGYRAGAGLVRIASTTSNRTILQTLVPEATFTDRDRLTGDDGDMAHALVAGPGIGTSAEARAALERALDLTEGKPVLLDADALNLHAGHPDALGRVAAGRPLVLTPHAGELERLTGTPAAEITADPVSAANAAAERFGCVVLLKGQPSVVAAPDAPIRINTAGSSDTAAAGMGDQLAGAIGAFLAAGVPVHDAAAAALFFSSRAADLCALGRALGPRDVAEALPLAFADPGGDSDLDLPFVLFDQAVRW